MTAHCTMFMLVLYYEDFPPAPAFWRRTNASTLNAVHLLIPRWKPALETSLETRFRLHKMPVRKHYLELSNQGEHKHHYNRVEVKYFCFNTENTIFYFVRFSFFKMLCLWFSFGTYKTNQRVFNGFVIVLNFHWFYKTFIHN